jgi:predicted transcriptional regulator
MSIAEIRDAIGALDPREKAILTAELFAFSDEPDPAELERALERGLADVEAGRVHEVEDVRNMIPRWTSKS